MEETTQTNDAQEEAEEEQREGPTQPQTQTPPLPQSEEEEEETINSSHHYTKWTLEQLIDQAIDHLWNTRLNEAEELLLPQCAQPPSGPEGPAAMWPTHHHAEVAFMRAVMTDENLEEAFQRIERAEALANNVFAAANKKNGLLRSLVGWMGRKESAMDGRRFAAEYADQLTILQALIVLAECNGMSALLHLKNFSYVRGGYFLRKSWKHYSSALSIQQQIKQLLYHHQQRQQSEHFLPLRPQQQQQHQRYFAMLNFGVGVFHFLVSMVPVGFLWLVQAIGFQAADKQTALAELDACKNVPCPRAMAAQAVVICIHWFLQDDMSTANTLMEEALQHYPSSAVLKHLKAHMCRKQGMVATAIRYYQEAIENSSQVAQLQLTGEYELAHCYWMTCRWTEAIPMIETYLQSPSSKNFRSFGAYKLGFCYWMEIRQRQNKQRREIRMSNEEHEEYESSNEEEPGEDDEDIEEEQEGEMSEEAKQQLEEETKRKIRELYQKIEGWMRPNFSFDLYALRKATKWLQAGCFTPFEEAFIPAWNLVEAANPQMALRYLRKIPLLLQLKRAHMSSGGKEGEDTTLHMGFYDCLALFNYVKGCMFKGARRYEEAIPFFKKVLSLEEKLQQEKWALPHSCVELAEIAIRQREHLREAEAFLNQTKRYTSYDFEQPLSLRIKRALQLLRQASRK